MTQEAPNRRAWLGITLVVVGLAFLMQQTNLLPFHLPHYVFSWKMLLIVIGFALILTRRWAGVVLLAVGGFFLLPEIFHIPRFDVRSWWPLALILVGVLILIRGIRKPGEAREKLDEDYMDEVIMFAGQEKIITSQNFRGGKVTTLFGGSEINLANAKLSPEKNVIDVFAIFGGSSYIVPSDWDVQMNLTAIFGGFSDKRRLVQNESTEPRKALILKGFVMFGGGEIKSA